MAGFSETPVEQTVTNWLSKMGWNLRTGKDLKGHQRPFANPIIDEILLAKIKLLNSLDDNAAHNALETLKQPLNNPDPIAANEQFLDKLVNGITLAVEGKDVDVKFIDFEDIWRNDFAVTNQYWVQGEKMVKTDIVLLINGMPVVPIEAKQRARKGTNWLEGVRQFSTYASRARQYWAVHGFGVACNGRIAKYGILGAVSEYFNEWKDTSLDTAHANPILDTNNDLCGHLVDENGVTHCQIDEVERMKRGIVGHLQPARVLDILKNFLVFERTPEGVVKKVARYQQLRAANKIVYRVEDLHQRQKEIAGNVVALVERGQKRGVIWHTQGSGKSLTMLYTAYKLRHSQKLDNPTVYLVVDRKDLKEQIGGTFEDCEFPNTSVPTSIGALKAKIATGPAEVIITTIQKFRDLGDIADMRGNVVVLIDEAHRSQYGDFQSELQRVFPNAFLFAFTGTPIPKTHDKFGAKESGGEVEHYLDRYSIEDSERDGATVKIRYTFGPQEWFMDKGKLAQGWAEISADLTEDEKRLVQKRVQPWKVFLKKDERVEALAKDIAEDYRRMVEPNGFKAQVVACDKEACVLYYNELLKYFDPSEMKIVFSTGNYENEEKYELFKDHYLEEGERKRVIKQFKRRITGEEKANGNNLKVLIVCNMLLTGFDAPIEQTMYLDSPLRDHNLLQAIARTNRPHVDYLTTVKKEFGRIVDYIGVFKNYRDALNYDPADLPAFEDTDGLVPDFIKALDKAMSPFAAIFLEDTYECSIAIVRKLSTLDQSIFENNVRDSIHLYEAISPHPALAESTTRNRFRWLLAIYEIYLEEFKRLDFDSEIHAAKTRELIRESARMTSFRGHLPEIEIDSNYIEKLKDSKLNPNDKAEKIIRDIETVIRRNELDSPIYVEFQERLERLIREKEEHANEIEELLLDLEGLYTDVDEAGSLPQRMGFTERGQFDMFIEVKNVKGDTVDEELLRRFVNDIAENIRHKAFPGWQDSELAMKDIKLDVEVLADDDDYADMNLTEDPELIEAIMKRIVQHYGVD